MSTSEAHQAKVGGNKLFSEGKYEEALGMYAIGMQKVTEEEPEVEAAILGNSALAAYKIGHYETALEFAKIVTSLHPGLVKNWERKFAILIALKDYDQAVVVSKKIKELFPEKVNLLRRLRKELNEFKAENKSTLPTLYSEKPAAGTTAAHIQQNEGTRLLERLIETLRKPNNNSKDVLVGGLLQKLTDPENFCKTMYKTKEPKADYLPKSLQALLNDDKYRQMLIYRLPQIKKRADDVLANVKMKGAADGNIMDEHTEKMLYPEVINEALAHEVFEMVNEILEGEASAYSKTGGIIASTEDEQADFDQLSAQCVADLFNDELGFAIQDGFMNDEDGEFQGLLRADVMELQKKGRLVASDMKEVYVKLHHDVQGPVDCWVGRKEAEESYPAIHFLLEQMLALPYELNKKSAALGRNLNLRSIPDFPANVEVFGLQNKKVVRECTGRLPRVDGLIGSKETGLMVSCVYHFNPDWTKEDEGLLVLKNETSAKSAEVQPIADRLVVYRSRQITSSIQNLSTTAQPRMSLSIYFPGEKIQGW